MASNVVFVSGFVYILFSTCQAFSSNFLALSNPTYLSRSHSPTSFPNFELRKTSTRQSLSSFRMQESNPAPIEEFWTRPRTTNTNRGVFFEIVTKDKPVWITGLRTGGHSFADHDNYTRLEIRVYSANLPLKGKELDEKAWTLIGQVEDFQLPRVEVGDMNPTYTSLPFNTVHIPANSGRAFCVHTNKPRGLALRRQLNFDSNNLDDPYYREWTDGVSDEGEHFKLTSGLVPGEKLFSEVSSDEIIRAFVGVVEYQLNDPGK